MGPKSFAPRARIEERNAEWRIKRVDQTSDNSYLLSCDGLSELVNGREAYFLTNLEKNIRVLQPEDTQLIDDSSDSYRASRLYIDTLMRRSVPHDAKTYLGWQAAMDVIPFQLEPGVGNGRFLIPLLKAGKNIVGIDSSNFMLEHARSALGKHGVSARLIHKSFHAYQTDERYDAIVIPAGSFQLIDSFDEAARLLTHFRDLLAEKGRLLIDIDPAHSIFLSKPSVRRWSLSPDSDITLETKRLTIDYASQVTRELHRYELWNEGVLQKQS